MQNLQFINPQAQSLESAVEYSEKSVVSKQIIKAQTGNITLFAFDEGEGLSEHSAPFDAFVQIIDGTAEITIGGKPNVLTKGEFIVMPANIPHALKALKRYKMMLVMIKS